MPKKVKVSINFDKIHIINSRYISFGRTQYFNINKSVNPHNENYTTIEQKKSPYFSNLGYIVDQETHQKKIEVTNPSYKAAAYLDTKLVCVVSNC